MSLLIVDDQMTARLDNANAPLEVCSRDGRRLGYFTPAKPAKRRFEPDITEEEAVRRLHDTSGPQYTPDQVVARLRELRCSR